MRPYPTPPRPVPGVVLLQRVAACCRHGSDGGWSRRLRPRGKDALLPVDLMGILDQVGPHQFRRPIDMDFEPQRLTHRTSSVARHKHPPG